VKEARETERARKANVRLRELGKLLNRLLEQLLVELNSNFNKLKKRIKRVRDIASKLPSR
jgi:hypothetical protein